MFKRRKLALKKDIEEVTSVLGTLQESIENISKQNEKLQRILRHYIPGSITGYSESLVIENNGYVSIKHETYVYKNGEEYIFDNLYIKNPIFSQGEKENIVLANDEKTGAQFVLDIAQGTSIQVKEGQNESQ